MAKVLSRSLHDLVMRTENLRGFHIFGLSYTKPLTARVVKNSGATKTNRALTTTTSADKTTSAHKFPLFVSQANRHPFTFPYRPQRQTNDLSGYRCKNQTSSGESLTHPLVHSRAISGWSLISHHHRRCDLFSTRLKSSSPLGVVGSQTYLHPMSQNRPLSPSIRRDTRPKSSPKKEMVARSERSDSAITLFSKIGLLGTSADADKLIEKVDEKSYKKGEAIVTEGERSNSMFVVKAGSCGVFKHLGGEEVYIVSLGSGEYGGLGSMFDNQPHSATVRAEVDNTVVYKLKHADFQEALVSQPELLQSVLAFMSQQLKLERNLLANYRAGPDGDKVRVLMYSAKQYEADAFEKELESSDLPFKFEYQEVKLSSSTASLARGFKAVCVFVNDVCDAKTIAELQMSGVEMILLRCAGFDRVDLKACTSMGITVARVPAYSPYAVAEHALGLLMTLNRKLHTAYNRVRNQNFSLDGLVGMDIHGKNVGVIGTGKIGQCFMDIVIGMGCKILAYDVYPAEKYQKHPQVKYVDLDTVFKESDVISLHCPLLDSTKHIVNASTLAMMKPHCILINTSRGALVNTKDLVDALKKNKIGGAGLDVYEQEADYFFQDKSSENIGDDVLARLLTFRNVVVSSHQAFLTHEALSNIANTTINNLKSFTEGNTLSKCSNSLNKENE